MVVAAAGLCLGGPAIFPEGSIVGHFDAVGALPYRWPRCFCEKYSVRCGCALISLSKMP